MNCANHPDLPVAAYCQFCGKPLCTQCAQTIRNIVGCEPCIAARLGAASGIRQGAMPGGSNYAMHLGDKNFQYTATGPLPPPHAPNPALAFIFGWIPGVGAMYNGQFAKGLLHVMVFVILIDLSRWNGVIGICIAAWVFYQVFDAYHTAQARRDGLPLPNPLGINDIGQWFTGPRGLNEPSAGAAAPFPAMPCNGAAGYAAGMPPMPPDQYDMPEIHPGIPTGAVILIGLGILFLLGNLGILSDHWLDHFWPLILIGLGAWILIRRKHAPPLGGMTGPKSGPTYPPASTGGASPNVSSPDTSSPETSRGGKQ